MSLSIGNFCQPMTAKRNGIIDEEKNQMQESKSISIRIIKIVTIKINYWYQFYNKELSCF